jgi:hypothetical protein
MEIKEKK